MISTSSTPMSTRSVVDVSRELAYTSYLRVAAMVGVVLIHVAGLTYAAAPENSAAWLVAAFLITVTKWCVPMFVLVSGALVLRPPQHPSPMAFYRRRLSRIGIPLLFWHGVYLVLSEVRAPSLTWQEHVTRFIGGNTYTALYFFWLILGLYLIAPFLWPVVQAYSRRVLLLAGAALTAVPVMDLVLRKWAGALGEPMPVFEPTIVTHFVPYVGFFLLGYALKDVVLRGARLHVTGLLALLAIIQLPVQITRGDAITAAIRVDVEVLNPLSYQGPIVGLSALLLFVYVRGLVHPGSRLAAPPLARWCRALGDLSFGVFACHLLVLYVLSRLLGLPDQTGATTVPGLLVQNGAVVVLAFVVSWLLSRTPLLRRTI
ncbi:MAG TPA: acyltransferase [Intrasporangium sp.]|uniref:acyltransferase n=1 Tax=Intrasporangium sp. TaxID=1925024 RepID=UPI002B47149D|nr:acyltransferase [Intrasporangium sp.]HKX66176.1 acyltransferase [Intrasporangium sp.]